MTNTEQISNLIPDQSQILNKRDTTNKTQVISKIKPNMALATSEPTKRRLMSARAKTSKIPHEIANLEDNPKPVDLTIRNLDLDIIK